MEDGEVRIVELPPMRAAVAHAHSASPELDAWRVLRAWAEPLGLLEPGVGGRVFGFNNPSPAAGETEYGYDLWVTTDREVVPADNVTLQELDGGLYAVARCRTFGNPGETIPRAWQELVGWQQRSDYIFAAHQWLEELVDVHTMESGDFFVDLYLPIARKHRS